MTASANGIPNGKRRNQMAILTAACGCIPGVHLCQTAEYLWSRVNIAYYMKDYAESDKWHAKYDEHMTEAQKTLTDMAHAMACDV